VKIRHHNSPPSCGRVLANSTGEKGSYKAHSYTSYHNSAESAH